MIILYACVFIHMYTVRSRFRVPAMFLDINIRNGKEYYSIIKEF